MVSPSQWSSPQAFTHLEARSFIQPPENEPSVDHTSSSQPGPVSSNMSERYFDGDLPDERTTGSNILVVGDEWVVQSLTEMRGDGIKPPFSYMKEKSPEAPVVQLKPIFY